MTPRSSTTAALRPNQELLTAWLLLLLDGGESHGYALSRRLADTCLTIQSSIMYRRLRVLEAQGCVASRWARPAGGPRRRVYEITGEGRRELDERVERVRAIRDGTNALLAAHNQSRGEDPRRGDAGSS
jgi:DNA-binding PadR family transcriptional regulator